MITKTDFIGIPCTDPERSRAFYVETLGLRPDERGRFEFWAGETCFCVWEPARLGIEFAGDIYDTSVSPMASSPTPTATT